MQFIDIKGAVLADTVYKDGELVGREITVTLPDVSFATAEHKAMGTLELPMLGQLEAMEASVTKTGYDKGVAQLAQPEAANLEFRFVHDVINSDNVSTPEGCKAFMRAVPKILPGGDLEPGSKTEQQITFAVSRYQLIVGGVEICLIDQLKGILRINGKDYAKSINSLL